MGRGVEMNCCGQTLRWTMFTANFLIWVASVAILVLGVWTVVGQPYLEELLGIEMYTTAAYILIATGCITFFVSFLGCFGALKEVKCMLLTYFIIVLLLFIVLLVGGILGYVFKNQAKKTVELQMMNTIKAYKTDNKDRRSKAWDETQQALKCCGSTNANDWARLNNAFSVGGNQVPSSCCRMGDDGKLMDCQRSPSSSNSYTEGCYKQVLGIVEKHAIIIGGVAIGVAFIMLLGLVISLVLFKMIN